MQNCNTVRKRCLAFLNGLNKLGFSNEVPLDQAVQYFSEITGYWDRTTIKAYFGVKQHTIKRLLRRRAVYASTMTVSNKNIELSEEFKESKGYLEKMHLVSYLLHGKVWFLKIESGLVVPQLCRKDVSESDLSMQNISLSSNSIGKYVRGSLSYVSNGEDICSKELETKQQLQNEREKTGSVDGEDDTQPLVYLEQMRKAKQEC